MSFHLCLLSSTYLCVHHRRGHISQNAFDAKENTHKISRTDYLVDALGSHLRYLYIFHLSFLLSQMEPLLMYYSPLVTIWVLFVSFCCVFLFVCLFILFCFKIKSHEMQAVFKFPVFLSSSPKRLPV